MESIQPCLALPVPVRSVVPRVSWFAAWVALGSGVLLLAVAWVSPASAAPPERLADLSTLETVPADLAGSAPRPLAAFETWIEQVSTGEVEYYLLEGASPGIDSLPDLFDREGFEP